MTDRAIGVALMILMGLPVGLHAQMAGFEVGISSGWASVQTPNGVVGPMLAGLGGPIFVGGSHARRFPEARAHELSGGPVAGRHARDIRRREPVIRNGPFVFVAPSAFNLAPGHEPRTPTHPVATPGVTAPGRGNRGVVTAQRSPGHFGTTHQGIQVIQPGIGPAISVRAPERHPGLRYVVRGTPRHEVIARFGTPRVQILGRNSETMIFGGTTIIIQHGVVAFIH